MTKTKIIFLATLFISLFVVAHLVLAAPAPVTGWAWIGADGTSTDNTNNCATAPLAGQTCPVGWVSFNCTNTGDCTPSYGVNIDYATSDISGQAWVGGGDGTGPSDQFFWLDFDSSATGPAGGSELGVARFDSATNKIIGWAPIVAGATTISWIHFCNLVANCGGIAYSVVINSDGTVGAAGSPNHYAYASDSNSTSNTDLSDDIGWIDFRPVNTIVGSPTQAPVTFPEPPGAGLTITSTSSSFLYCTNNKQEQFSWTTSGGTQDDFQIQVTGPAPTYQAAGTAVSGGLDSSFAVAWPAHQANDIGLLIIETANQSVSETTTGWAAVLNSPQGTGTGGGTAATRLTVFWKRAASSSEAAANVSGLGNHKRAQIITFRGVTTSGNPWDVTAGDVASLASTGVTIPGAITTIANTLVVAIVANATDTTIEQTSNTWTNSNLSSLTERVDGNTASNNGGGFGVATGIKATAGAYGNTTANLVTSSVQGRISLALKPVNFDSCVSPYTTCTTGNTAITYPMPLDILSYSTSYDWRMQVKDSGSPPQWSAWTSWTTFTTGNHSFVPDFTNSPLQPSWGTETTFTDNTVFGGPVPAPAPITYSWDFQDAIPDSATGNPVTTTFGVAGPAPTYKAFSAITASTGADVTVTLPTHDVNDILLMEVIVRDQNNIITWPSGWTQIATVDRGTTSRYWWAWKRAASNSEINPLIDKSTTTGDTYAAVIVYSGAITTGDPWEVKGAPQTGTADPLSLTGITTLTPNSLIVAAVAGENDNNSAITTTGANPAGYAEHYVESVIGLDGVITFSEAARTTAGATGTVSINWDIGIPVGDGGILLALKPVIAATDSSQTVILTVSDGDTPVTHPACSITKDVNISAALPFPIFKEIIPR